MSQHVLGIHHVTAMSGDPQVTVDFYVNVLGLRLTKKTVNYESPGTYHFYFGNEKGDPGTLLTFFPLGANSLTGRVGNGQVTAVSLLVPADALEFWTNRLTKHDIDINRTESRFGDDVIAFDDYDGIPLELVAGPPVDATPPAWSGGGIDERHAIRGMHSGTITVAEERGTIRFLTEQLGFQKESSEGNRHRLGVNGGGPLKTVDVLSVPNGRAGLLGVGTIHHIAWATENDESQASFIDRLNRGGVGVTVVKDRQYFKSIYMNEPGGAFNEIATNGPGFLVDEPVASLGEALQLPPWFEEQRAEIEASLPPVSINQEEVRKQ